MSIPECNGGLLLLWREPAIRFARFVRLWDSDMLDQLAANADGHMISERDAADSMRGGKFSCLARSWRDISGCGCLFSNQARANWPRFVHYLCWPACSLWRARLAILQHRQAGAYPRLLLLELQDTGLQINHLLALLLVRGGELGRQALDLSLIDRKAIAGALTLLELARVYPASNRALILAKPARGLSGA